MLAKGWVQSIQNMRSGGLPAALVELISALPLQEARSVEEQADAPPRCEVLSHLEKHFLVEMVRNPEQKVMASLLTTRMQNNSHYKLTTNLTGGNGAERNCHSVKSIFRPCVCSRHSCIKY